MTIQKIKGEESDGAPFEEEVAVLSGVHYGNGVCATASHAYCNPTHTNDDVRPPPVASVTFHSNLVQKVKRLVFLLLPSVSDTNSAKELYNREMAYTPLDTFS